MGWFEFVPFMECLYHILCFNNKIDGTLNINGKNVDFSGGKGYIERIGVGLFQKVGYGLNQIISKNMMHR
jgi:hypothetical protein